MKQVLLFLAQGFEEIEASAFSDIMGWSREHGLFPVNLKTTALRPEVRSVWGTRVIPHLDFGQLDPAQYDALAIPGGFESAGYYEDAFREEFLELIRTFERGNKPLASVCTGALPLGRAGVLRGRQATTYPLPGGERMAQLSSMGALVKQDPVVVDGNIITSAGPSTAMAVAFRLLEMLTGADNVREVKKFMVF